MTTRKITDAAVEPFTVAEAKLWLGVDHSEHDVLLAGLITAVRQACETETRRTLLLTTWERVLDAFPSAIRLDWPRVIAVQSIKYLDDAGTEQTLDPADYTVDADSEPGYVVPGHGLAWPATRCQVNAVRVRYTAGYGGVATAVPKNLLLWMQLHLAHYYRNREATVVGTSVAPLPFADSLLDGARVWTL